MADTARRQSTAQHYRSHGGHITAYEGDRLVVAYDFPCGLHRMKLVEANDLPVIRRLAAEGKLGCSNGRARELFTR